MSELARPTAESRKTGRPGATRGPELSVVVPTFNERENIALLHRKLGEALRGRSWEVIFVDDDSPDGTSQAAKALAREHGNVRCLKRVGRRGLASACIEGILASAAPYVAVMDADLQHDETVLGGMLDKAVAGVELVVGSRYVAGGSADDGLSRARLQGSVIATWLSRLVTRAETSDPMSGFFLIERGLFDRLAPRLAPDGFKILLDILVCANSEPSPIEIAEVPYQFRARQSGQSKMSAIIALQFVGLWLSKLSGGLLPPSFLLFAMVGSSGVVVHMGVLALAHLWAGVPFLMAQILATLVAMTSNFFFNNVLTFRDKRLRGARIWTGLLSFYIVCSIGALANVSVASVIYQIRPGPIVAGFAGAIMSAVFNYAVTRVFTWR